MFKIVNQRYQRVLEIARRFTQSPYDEMNVRVIMDVQSCWVDENTGTVSMNVATHEKVTIRQALLAVLRENAALEKRYVDILHRADRLIHTQAAVQLDPLTKSLIQDLYHEIYTAACDKFIEWESTNKQIRSKNFNN